MKLYGGVDLHSNNGVFALKDEDGKRVFCKRLPNDLPCVLEALKPYGKDIEAIAVERRDRAPADMHPVALDDVDQIVANLLGAVELPGLFGPHHVAEAEQSASLEPRRAAVAQRGFVGLGHEALDRPPQLGRVGQGRGIAPVDDRDVRPHGVTGDIRPRGSASPRGRRDEKGERDRRRDPSCVR